MGKLTESDSEVEDVQAVGAGPCGSVKRRSSTTWLAPGETKTIFGALVMVFKLRGMIGI